MAVTVKCSCGNMRKLYRECDYCGPEKPAEDKPVIDQMIDDLNDRPSPSYKPLADVLSSALAQAANGKGKERHANGRDFIRQPIMEIGRMCGLGYPTGQAQKKTQEAVGMFNRGEADSAVQELLGAINYLAAAIVLIRETQ